MGQVTLLSKCSTYPTDLISTAMTVVNIKKDLTSILTMGFDKWQIFYYLYHCSIREWFPYHF